MPNWNPRWSEPIWGEVVDVLRYLNWLCVGGLIAVGACWCGGVVAMQAYCEWQHTGPPRRQRPSGGTVEREAARGIREIEVFLGAGNTRRFDS
jgi:hypothetical protein